MWNFWRIFLLELINLVSFNSKPLNMPISCNIGYMFNSSKACKHYFVWINCPIRLLRLKNWTLNCFLDGNKRFQTCFCGLVRQAKTRWPKNRKPDGRIFNHKATMGLKMTIRPNLPTSLAKIELADIVHPEQYLPIMF